MTASAGMGNLQQMINQWMGGSGSGGISVVGQETPEWEFPMGEDRVPESVRSWFLRSDAGPSRLNEFLQNASPEDIDKFRAAINMGVLRPKNQAAQNIAVGYGGFQAGDQTLLGPMINGMPSGMNPQYWQQFNNLIQTAADYQIKMLDSMGYFNNMPTLERQKVEQELAQGWKDRATNEFIAMEQQRANQAKEGLTQQEINNQNLQKMSELFGGQMVTDPATGQASFKPTEEARQFNTEQSGYLDGQATLTREQQAFNQAKDVAQAASNPRDYIYAQMLGNARGGLAGQAPTNQIQQTTFGPPTTAQQPQFQSPGGQFNQLPNLSTMQRMGPESLMGAQAGSQMAMPNAQQAGQPAPTGTMGLNSPSQWQQWTNDANTQWGGAQQGMAGLPGATGWQGLTPQWQTPTAGQPEPYQFQRDGTVGIEPWQMNQDAMRQKLALLGGQPKPDGVSQLGQMVDDTNWTPEQRQAYGAQRQQQINQSGIYQQRQAALGTANPTGSLSQQNVAAVQNAPVTTSAFSQALMQNRVVPKSGALQNNGAWMTPGQIQSSFNPNKIRAQDYMKGNTSERQGFNAVGSLAGYSDDDLSDIMKSNLPKFNAPSSGRMI